MCINQTLKQFANINHTPTTHITIRLFWLHVKKLRQKKADICTLKRYVTHHVIAPTWHLYRQSLMGQPCFRTRFGTYGQDFACNRLNKWMCVRFLIPLIGIGSACDHLYSHIKKANLVYRKCKGYKIFIFIAV